MTNYLQINYADGAIFQYSKDAKEGYEPNTNTKGVVSYRKIYNKGLYGTLKGVSLRDSNFGKEISLFMVDKNGDTNYLNIPLFDAKKNLASYAESFITVLPSIEIGKEYRIYPYNIQEEGSKYSKTGVSVVLADIQAETVDKTKPLAKLTYTYTKDGVEVKGDIPATIWEEDFDGSRSMNAKAKNKYLYDTLLKHLSDTPKQEQAPAPQQKPTPKVEAPKTKEEEADDLPF